MNEVHQHYLTAAEGFDVVVKHVRADQWSCPSPCDAWLARDVVAHVVQGHRGMIANLSDRESRPLGSDEDPVHAWQQVTEIMRAMTQDPETMSQEVDGPTGKTPAGVLIDGFVTMDVLVHTWDLARAVGADERLDEDSVLRSYETLKPMDAMIRRPGVFGPRLDPPAGADAQTAFLSFLGRRT